MNSSLQSLLTLTDFVRDISRQEEVWSSAPQAELIRYSSHTHGDRNYTEMSELTEEVLFSYFFFTCRCFMNIVRCHHSVDARNKLRALLLFKRVLSIQAPEFQDIHQKVSQLL